MKEKSSWKYLMGICLFSLDFWGMELLFFLLHCLCFCQIPMRISFSPVFLWEKWYKNITFLTRKFIGLCMDSLATSCPIPSNKTQPFCHSCQMKQQPDKLRAWCSCINVSAPQGAAHPPCCSHYTKCFSDSISSAFCHIQHPAVTPTEWPTEPLLSERTESFSFTTRPTVCSAHSVQHQNFHF